MTPTIEVIHADSGIRGLQILKDLEQIGESPCLVILDVNMPVMDGRETLKEIRKIDEEIPIVLFTTGISATTKELNEVVEQHHASLEGKPHNMKDIVAKVHKMLLYCA